MVPFADQDRLYFPATMRNRGAIGDVLSQWLPNQGAVLEVASGSGEHAVTFQRMFPDVLWQASDPDLSHCNSINAWIQHESLSELMPQALRLDVLDRPWPLSEQIRADIKAIVAINLIHISPWYCCESLVEQASRHLPIGGCLIFYGPFRRNGFHTSASNEAFDQSLRQRNVSWGVRDLEAVEKLCGDADLKHLVIQELPANNLMIKVIKIGKNLALNCD